MHIRRVIAAKASNGKSVFVSDGPSPRAHAMAHVPGLGVAPIWSTPALPSLDADPVDPMPHMTSLIPQRGETQFVVVSLPPDQVFADPTFDAALAKEERQIWSPGLAETFEPDHPGMHTTPTIDYGVVLDGEVWLELDDQQAVRLRKHDTFVQHGTRHAWRNRTDRPVLLAVVMVGGGAD